MSDKQVAAYRESNRWLLLTVADVSLLSQVCRAVSGPTGSTVQYYDTGRALASWLAR